MHEPWTKNQNVDDALIIALLILIGIVAFQQNLLALGWYLLVTIISLFFFRPMPRAALWPVAGFIYGFVFAGEMIVRSLTRKTR